MDRLAQLLRNRWIIHIRCRHSLYHRWWLEYMIFVSYFYHLLQNMKNTNKRFKYLAGSKKKKMNKCFTAEVNSTRRGRKSNFHRNLTTLEIGFIFTRTSVSQISLYLWKIIFVRDWYVFNSTNYEYKNDSLDFMWQIHSNDIKFNKAVGFLKVLKIVNLLLYYSIASQKF